LYPYPLSLFKNVRARSPPVPCRTDSRKKWVTGFGPNSRVPKGLLHAVLESTRSRSIAIIVSVQSISLLPQQTRPAYVPMNQRRTQGGGVGGGI